MMVMGDLHPVLFPHVAKAAVTGSATGPVGIALRFEAFARPVISVVADATDLTCELVSTLAGGADEKILVVAAYDPALMAALGSGEADDDLWMIRDLTTVSRSGGWHPDVPPDAMARFYAACGMDFFHLDFLRLGPWASLHVGADLVCAAGLGFVVPALGYAHIANVATLPAFRGRGLATRAVDQLCLQLGAEGYARCGLLCEKADHRLVQFYERLGFRTAGRFLTVTVKR